MDARISCCGIDCSQCENYPDSCKGCSIQKGHVYWTVNVSLNVCPIYGCCRQKKQMDHCGLCKQVPCNIWKEMKDPSWTDEQHQESIDQRLVSLKKL
ncbi:MAG: DUF3795 domain-containing protein [Candidatus Methanogranum gryphiswaldense]|nr:MAG: DUF3795 domain-containing protein [Candidatus Methanogranum sp. U3.2.1]